MGWRRAWREARRLGAGMALELLRGKARRELEQRTGADHRRRIRARINDQEWDRLRRRLGNDLVSRWRAGAAGLGWYGARPEAAGEIARAAPEHAALVAETAATIRQGKVGLFGREIEVVAADGTIDWQRDWFADGGWDSRVPSARMPIGREPGLDPKVPWELGRCLHLLPLAQSWRLHRDPADPATVARHITSFIAANPVGYGIQWVSTMDVAIRAANWLAAWDLIRDADAAEALAEPLLRSLLEHGRFIIRNLEDRDGIRSNHYLADLTGLAYLGRLAPLYPPAARWAALARREAAREILAQTLEDGFSFEASAGYHRLAVELLGFAALAQRGSTGEAFRIRFAAMLHAVRVLTTARGQAPQIGDSDDARLHLLNRRDPRDFSYLIPLFAPLAGWEGEGETPESLWVRGPASAPAPVPARPAVQALFLPRAGIARLSDGATELVAVCGPNGQKGRGGHAHNDKLSFTLFQDGDEIIADPGTWVYTRDVAARQEFRSTLMHSTIAAGNAEQNRFSETSAFRLLPDARPVGLALRREDDLWVYRGGHTGFERAPYFLRHSRRIAHRCGTTRWTILDLLQPCRPRRGPLPLCLTLPLAPGVTVHSATRDGWRAGNERVALTGRSRLRGITGSWDQLEGWYSSGYSRRAPSRMLRFNGTLLPGHTAYAIRMDLDVAAAS